MPPVTPPATPPVAAPFIPPASAIVIWALPTKFEVIRCVAWEEGESKWRFAVVFGNELLKTELVPDLETLWGAADMLRRYLAPSSNSLTLGPPPRARRRRERRPRPELARSGDR